MHSAGTSWQFARVMALHKDVWGSGSPSSAYSQLADCGCTEVEDWWAESFADGILPKDENFGLFPTAASFLLFRWPCHGPQVGFSFAVFHCYSLQEASDDAIAGNFKFLKITESMKQILFWLVKYQWLKATGFSPSVPRDKAAYVVTGLVSVTWLIASQYMVHLDFWLLGENIFRSIFLHYKVFLMLVGI